MRDKIQLRVLTYHRDTLPLLRSAPPSQEEDDDPHYGDDYKKDQNHREDIGTALCHRGHW